MHQCCYQEPLIQSWLLIGLVVAAESREAPSLQLQSFLFAAPFTVICVCTEEDSHIPHVRAGGSAQDIISPKVQSANYLLFTGL